MKKIFSIILVLMMITFPSFAQNSDSDVDSEDIILEYDNNNPNYGRHRSAMRININAYYTAISRTIDIYYIGEAEGEVFLYLNGIAVDYSSELNTTFQLSGSGLYHIEVITSSWKATGEIKIQ